MSSIKRRIYIKKNATRKNLTDYEKQIICGSNLLIYNSFEHNKTNKEFIKLNKLNYEYDLNFFKYLKSPLIIKPCDNFYNFVNDSWISNVKLTTDEKYISKVDSFTLTQNKVFYEIIDIFNEISKSNSTSKEVINMKEFFDSAITYTPLQKSMNYMTECVNIIDNLLSTTIKNNVWKLLAFICKNKIVESNGSPIFFEIKPDDLNTSIYSIYLEPIRLPFDLGIFIIKNEDNQFILNKYKKYLSLIIHKISNNKFNLDAQSYIDVQIEIVKCFYDTTDSNLNSIYNKINKNESFETYDFNFEQFSKEMGFENTPDYFVVTNTNYFKKVTELLLKNWNTPKWRNYWKILYITQIVRFTKEFKHDYDNFNIKFVNKEYRPYDTVVNAIRLTLIPYTNLLSNLYVEKYKNEYSINYIHNMILDLKSVLKRKIENNKWMTTKTKRYSLLKLKNLKISVGIKDNDISITDPDLNFINNDIWGNLLRINEWKYKELMSVINKDIKEKLHITVVNWTSRPFVFVDLQVFDVNASYNHTRNEIFVPLAFIQKPFIDLEEGALEYNLANIGFTLAHELSHALDFTGSKYDYNGNLNDWWCENDKKIYLKFKENIIKQYLIFSKRDNQSLNMSDNSMSENFADINAVNICCEYLEDYQDKNQMPLIFRKEIFKNFFLYFANYLKEKTRKQFISSRIFKNLHALDEYRVNIPLSRVKLFKVLYNVKKGDGMYWNTDLALF